jgi:hypothetical protein
LLGLLGLLEHAERWQPRVSPLVLEQCRRRNGICKFPKLFHSGSITKHRTDTENDQLELYGKILRNLLLYDCIRPLFSPRLDTGDVFSIFHGVQDPKLVARQDQRDNSRNVLGPYTSYMSVFRMSHMSLVALHLITEM